MHCKLFDLPQSRLDLIIQLETEAILPVLLQSGIQVSPEDIRAEVFKDPEQKVVLVFQEERPSAWLRYGIEDERLFVKSIHLVREGSSFGALRGLLRKVVLALEFYQDHTIESVVQVANTRSMVLHEKLGFRRIKENAKAIRYSILANDLKANLHSLLKN